jgi:Cellulase (glycosyl hydrolase family 5)
MSRWALAVLASLLVIGGAAVLFHLTSSDGEEQPVAMPESPMPGRLLVGFQDDASLRWAPDRAQMLDRARDAGASVIRTTVAWHATAPKRPAQPANAFDPAYRFDDLDDLARSAQQRGIELLLTIWGTPRWANGGETPNRPPTNPYDLETFAQAVADRYSGRHPGYPAVRLFSAWNEPNLEQFLAPQFDEAGRSVGPALYAPLARAIYAGVKRANPDALVALGETSPRGRDAPSPGRVQDSHSPPRFARLLSEERPLVEFDAWAQHPYPPRAQVAPSRPVRWPRVGLQNLERFGDSLDDWFGREDTPLWVTEYAHETLPDVFGVVPELQATYADEAVALVSANPRIRMFVWFILRDSPGTPWESGLLAEDGSPKPAFARFSQAAHSLDARNPVLPEEADVARVPALEIAYHTAAGSPIEVRVEGEPVVSVPLGIDGWLEVPLADPRRPGEIKVRATDANGRSVERSIRFE